METVIEKKNISPFKQRFSDAIWYEKMKQTPVLLIGAGGIGSWVAFCLSRIGCNITLYDHDTVGAENIAGQLYSIDHINMNKASATALLARRFSGDENTFTALGRYEEKDMSNEVVVAAFDNMAGRKLAFEKWLDLMNSEEESAKKNYIFIDGRLLAEKYQVYTVVNNPNSIAKYQETLKISDSEIPDVACTLKSTTHCSMGIASDMIGVLTNFFSNLVYEANIREIPFKIEKSIDLFTYDVEI